MSESGFAIVGAEETIYFSHEAGKLRQWVLVTVESGLGESVEATAAVTAGCEEVLTHLTLEPGVREYRCFAPTLWPDRPPEDAARVRLTAGGQTATGTVHVGHHRPWTVYVLSDACTDYAWVYGDEQTLRADDAELTEAELELIEATRDYPEASRNHYNMAVGRQVEFHLERYPEHRERLFDAIRQGAISVNPFFNMELSGDLSLEELIRQFYPVRNWARQQGFSYACANHQETPSAPWFLATLLAECGIPYLIKGNLPYECPWAKRYAEPPVFAWEGPDGKRVLYRRRNEDYVEGAFVLRDLRAVNTALHTRVIPEAERLGERYPFNAWGLVGVYGDLSARARDLPAKKVAMIAAYNAQGWEYPKLVNAAQAQFWADIETQIAQRGLSLEVYRGDYGAGWEAWPASLAASFAGWRRAQERAGVADKLMAILWALDRDACRAQEGEWAQSWLNLICLSDHAWNGANDANRELNARLRQRWQKAANEGFDRVIAAGLAALGRRVATGAAPHVLVFNGLGWSRDGLVRAPGVEPGARLVDAESGEEVPTQTMEDGVYALARQVPAVGYRTYAVEPGTAKEAGCSPFQVGRNRLEGPLYAVEVSPMTGGIVSLYDKVRGRELVDAASPYHFNQCLYVSAGVEHTPRRATVEAGASGPLFSQLIVRAGLKNTRLTSTITLYSALDRVDIENVLEKRPTSEKQELDFVFPFHVPDHEVRYEAPGVVINPATDCIPGAGLAVTAVRHFVDLFNGEYGVTLSQADSGLVEFGHRTTDEDPEAPDLSRATVLAMALDNIFDWNEAVRDQAGESHFRFRFSVRGHGPGFDPTAALQFGWEDNNPLEAMALAAGQAAKLPPVLGFVGVSGNAVLTSLKVAEEEGLVARLWDVAGQGGEATLTVHGLGRLREARAANPLEVDRGPLPVEGENVRLPVKARGLSTVRLLFE